GHVHRKNELELRIVLDQTNMEREGVFRIDKDARERSVVVFLSELLEAVHELSETQDLVGNEGLNRARRGRVCHTLECVHDVGCRRLAPFAIRETGIVWEAKIGANGEGPVLDSIWQL